jgi:hypothetical protein
MMGGGASASFRPKTSLPYLITSMYKHSTFNDDSLKLDEVDCSAHEWHDNMNTKVVYSTSSFKATQRPLASLLESARRFYSLEVEGVGILKIVMASTSLHHFLEFRCIYVLTAQSIQQQILHRGFQPKVDVD